MTPKSVFRPLLRRLGIEMEFLLLSFPIAVASFAILVAGLALGAGLMITLLGLPILVTTLSVGRGFAGVQRRRLLAVSGTPMQPARYRSRTGSDLRSWLWLLGDRQAWLDALHGLLVFPLATFSFSLTVSWCAVILFGFPWPLFGRALDRAYGRNSQDLAQLLGIHSYASRSLFYVASALFCLVTLPLLVRGLTSLHVRLGRSLLANGRVTALQARVEELTASRDATARAEATSLRRLERDLHDGPQQRLTRIAMDLGMVQRKFDTDPASAKPMLDEALEQTREAIAEVRALSRGIAPPILVDRGLAAALGAVAARATVQVDLDIRLDDGERLPPAIENAVYFVVAEALTNIAKHAEATTCKVLVKHNNGRVHVDISDNGRGGAHVSKGHGLAGIDERIAGLDGSLAITSPAGGPTQLTATLPCA
jgi:signal transduction histidine kinase